MTRIKSHEAHTLYVERRTEDRIRTADRHAARKFKSAGHIA